MIAQRATLGHSRQIFFVSIGGFDTHTAQYQFQPPNPAFQGLAAALPADRQCDVRVLPSHRSTLASRTT